MHRKSLRYFSYLLILILLQSCEKDVKNVKLPPFEQKLVIASFISPSYSISYVIVKSNKKIYGELGLELSPGNLRGTISDDSTVADLEPMVNGLKFPRSKMHIRNGKSYTLSVTSDNGISAEAFCTVPEERDLFLVADTFSILHQVPGYREWREFKIRLTFTDFQGETNWYRLAGYYYLYRTEQGSSTPKMYKEPLWFEKPYLADREANTDSKFETTAGLNRAFSYYDSAFVKIYLLNTEESYYLYHTSLANYSGDEKPFSEATPVYTNIKGGFGIFAAYTSDSLVVRLK